MKILVCPDSFKGTLTAPEAASAIRAGILETMPDAEVISLPVGDGGEGTVMALTSALSDCEEIECLTADPLRRPMTATYSIADGTTALIESAAASGLTLLTPSERDIMKADTYGTGLLILDAFHRGIRNFIVCMGGTATCDCGQGAFEALSDFKEEISMQSVRFTLLCDVENPLCGPEGAAAVFGPQKGATGTQIPVVDDILRQRAQEYAAISGRDVTKERFAGAAGGLAGMLMACFGARPTIGIKEVLRLLRFEEQLKDADLVITGEGRGDATTLRGKAAKGILDTSTRRGVPVILLAGCVSYRDMLLRAGFHEVVQATPDNPESGVSHSEYLKRAAAGLFIKN